MKPKANETKTETTDIAQLAQNVMAAAATLRQALNKVPREQLDEHVLNFLDYMHERLTDLGIAPPPFLADFDDVMTDVVLKLVGTQVFDYWYEHRYKPHFVMTDTGDAEEQEPVREWLHQWLKRELLTRS